jgi:hypothetical protein
VNTMVGLSRQYAAVAILACATVAWLLASAGRSRDREIEAGFWFEPVSFDDSQPMTERLGGAITGSELQTVEAVARGEISSALSGLRISVSNNHDAQYKVRVVQRLYHPLSWRYPGPSGESRSTPGLGGQGAVNFTILANQAVAYAPPALDRPAMLEAIGRGVGRAAVHEFAHQLLGSLPIHDSTDNRSFEYRSADRAAQFYGEMHWDIAWPILHQRFGRPGP